MAVVVVEMPVFCLHTSFVVLFVSLTPVFVTWVKIATLKNKSNCNSCGQQTIVYVCLGDK